MGKPDKTQSDVLEVLRGVVDSVKAGTVFGAPVSYKGLTVLPVARIAGGGGGGRGEDANGRGAEGSGGGIGLSARPVGVYVIKDDEVTWSPAVDVTKVVLGGQIVGIVALLTLRTLFKILRDRRQRAPEQEPRKQESRESREREPLEPEPAVPQPTMTV
ncbi:spore germination protein GerW family protein [Kribbella sp. NPDC051936]|uniref:spore germination protein GerW family protein n=1 Tax=Kribbella sp. NPDC051936 TaxID=3154946 RepID=UPI00343996DB